MNTNQTEVIKLGNAKFVSFFTIGNCVYGSTTTGGGCDALDNSEVICQIEMSTRQIKRIAQLLSELSFLDGSLLFFADSKRACEILHKRAHSLQTRLIEIVGIGAFLSILDTCGLSEVK
jgi:hypothetical protein